MTAIDEEARALIARVTRLAERMLESPFEMVKVIGELGFMDIPRWSALPDGQYYSDRAAYLSAVAEKIIPAGWEWEIVESIDGNAALILLQKHSC